MLKKESASAAAPAGRRHLSRARVAERQMNLLYYASMTFVFFYSAAETMLVSINIPFQFLLVLLGLTFCMCVLLLNQKEVLLGLRSNPCVMVVPVYSVFLVLTACSSFITNEATPEINVFREELECQLFIIDMIFLVLYSLAMGRAMNTFDYLFKFTLVLAVCNDLQMLGGVYYTDGFYETYFVGTKFDVVYMHMNLMAIFFTRLKLNRKGNKNVQIPGILLLLFLSLNVMISLRVDCNTGMLGSMLIAMVIYVSDRSKIICNKWMCSVKFFAMVVVLSTAFVSYIFWILENPLVQYIVVDVLGRNLTLTGRTDIYRKFPMAMTDHWMWGYGLGTAFLVSMNFCGCTDVQNAVLQWVLQVGVPATVAMILLFCFIISFCQKMHSPHHVMPLLALIYVYLLLGTVEITMNNNFWLFMMMLLLLAGAEVPSIDRRLQVSSKQPVRNTRKGVAKKKHEN